MHSEKVKNKFYYNLLLILVSFGIIYFFIYPMYTGSGQIYSPKKGIKALLQQKKDITSAVTVVAGYDNKLGAANQNYSSSIASLNLDDLNKILPTSADPVLIAYEITGIAKRSGMLLEGLSVRDGASDNKKYNVMNITFSTEGSFNSLKNLLHDLERSQRIYNVTSLSFSTDKDSTASSLYKYSISVETYYLATEETKN